MEQQLQKPKKKRDNLVIGIIIVIVLLIAGTLAIIVGANKTTMYDPSNAEPETASYEEDTGHLGGDQLLFKEKVEGEISIPTFEEKLDSGEDFYTWFYSPYCPFCHQIQDTVFQKFDEYNANFVVVNANENLDFQKKMNIEYVPMLVHYKDGKQVSYVVGAQEESVFSDFFANDKTTDVE